MDEKRKHDSGPAFRFNEDYLSERIDGLQADFTIFDEGKFEGIYGEGAAGRMRDALDENAGFIGIAEYLYVAYNLADGEDYRMVNGLSVLPVDPKDPVWAEAAKDLE